MSKVHPEISAYKCFVTAQKLGGCRFSSGVHLPFLLLFIHRDSSRTQRHHHQQSTNHRQGLEKVVFEKIPHWLIRWDIPPGVEPEVENVEPGDENQSRQLCLVADRDEDHENGADKVLYDLHGGHLEPEQGQEHEYQQNTSSQLKIHFRFIFPEGRNSGKQRLSFHTRFSQNQQQSSYESQVTKQKLEIPQNTVGNSLENNYKEENPTGDVNLVSCQHHGHCAQLTNQIHHYKHRCQKPSTAPGDIHIFPLLTPLNPHPNSILEECGHQTKSRQVRQHMLRTSCHFISYVLGFGQNFILPRHCPTLQDELPVRKLSLSWIHLQTGPLTGSA